MAHSSVLVYVPQTADTRSTGSVLLKGFITIAGHAMNSQHSHARTKMGENPESLFTLQVLYCPGVSSFINIRILMSKNTNS